PAILQGRQRPLARYCVPRAPQATAFRVSMVRAIPAPSSTLNVLARSRGRPATPSRSTATSYSRALASIAVARTQLSSAMPASRIRRTPSLASSTGSAVARNAECLGFSTKWSSGRGWSSAAMRPAGPGVAEAIATSSRKSDCQRAKLSLANTTGQPRSLKRSRSVWMLRAARSAAGAITSASGKSNSPTMSTTTRAGGSGVAILSRGLWPARRAMSGRWRGRSLPAPRPGSRFPGSCGSRGPAAFPARADRGPGQGLCGRGSCWAPGVMTGSRLLAFVTLFPRDRPPGRGAMGTGQEAQRGGFPLARPACPRCGARQAAVLPAVENAGVDIGAAADGRRVAQRLRDLHHHPLPQPCEVGFVGVVGRGRGREQAERSQGRAPGTEILGGERRAHFFAQVRVDHAGVHRLRSATVLAVLEQVLARQLVQGAHHADDPPVVQL